MRGRELRGRRRSGAARRRRQHGSGRLISSLLPREMDLSAMDVTTLPDDMVVEILSRLPFKSFCRFKCVSKAWLAFSHDPNYSEKLPKIPTGLLYQKSDNFAIKLVGLPRNEEKFDDGALSFLPHVHNNVELTLEDCCNGLILCKHTSIQDNHASLIRRKYTGLGNTSTGTGRFDMCSHIYHFTVCNPETREWKTLPGIHHDEEYPFSKAILVFNPSLSPHFYVFHFKEHVYDPKEGGLWVFSSDLSRWLVYDAWRNSRIDSVCMYPHLFIDGSLYLFSLRWVKRISVLNGFDAMSSHIPPNHQAIRLPHDPSSDSSNGLSVTTPGLYTGGCFGQSPGTLHYALPDDDGRAIRIWSFDVTGPYEWSLNYHLSMTDAFGRDDLARYDSTRKKWYPVYDIAALDLEREFVFLFVFRASKLYSYCISTGKLNEFHDFAQDERVCLRRFFHYVPCYTSFNAT